MVEDNLRVIRRGFDEVREAEIDSPLHDSTSAEAAPAQPFPPLPGRRGSAGIGADPGRFWEQVGYLYKTGEDGIADPFAAISAIPAATSSIRDMTDVRFEVPEFVADKCTGCSQCWVAVPRRRDPRRGEHRPGDARRRDQQGENGGLRPLRQAGKPLAKEAAKLLKGVPFTTFATRSPRPTRTSRRSSAWTPSAARRSTPSSRRSPRPGDFPLAKTTPFFDVAREARRRARAACSPSRSTPRPARAATSAWTSAPTGALITVKQDDDDRRPLRRNWELGALPDTDDRYINIPISRRAIGVLSSLLLKKENYRSMVGGDGACMGCGEKTAIHLVLSAVNALMLPRVEEHVCKRSTS